MPLTLPFSRGPARSQMKRIVIWASIQYAVHVDGATVHVSGPEERHVEFGDGTTSFATLSGGEGFINSTVPVNAPDFVTMTGTSVNEMMTLIREQQTILVSRQVEIDALKAFVGMIPSPPSSPGPIYVEPGIGTLQAAVDSAPSGSELDLVNGTYTATGDNVLVLNKSITLRAQYPGGAILDGQDARRVIFVDELPTGALVHFEGLRITNGVTNGYSAMAYGAGLYILAGNREHGTRVELHNVQIVDNAARYGGDIGLWRGGGAYIGGGSNVSFAQCELSENRASHGAGVYIDSSTVSFLQSTIHSNIAGYKGAGIKADSSDIVLDRSSIRFNTGGDYGGGINTMQSTVALMSTVVLDNTAPWNGGASNNMMVSGSTCAFPAVPVLGITGDISLCQ